MERGLGFVAAGIRRGGTDFYYKLSGLAVGRCVIARTLSVFFRMAGKD